MERKSSERVRAMKREFMTLHNDGYGIYEIAEHFGLHFTTVYRHLEEVALENDVSRESLLATVRTKHRPKVSLSEDEKTAKVTFEEIGKHLEDAENSLKDVITNIDKLLKEEEQ